MMMLRHGRPNTIVMGGGVSQIATTLHMAMKNLGGDIVNEVLYSFGTAYNAGYVESAAETVLTDYSRKLDYRFTSNHAENLAISMWRSDDMIFCQLTGIGNETTVPTDEPDATPAPDTANPDDGLSNVQKMKVVNVNSYVNLREAASTKSESLIQIPKDVIVEYNERFQNRCIWSSNTRSNVCRARALIVMTSIFFVSPTRNFRTN